MADLLSNLTSVLEAIIAAMTSIANWVVDTPIALLGIILMLIAAAVRFFLTIVHRA